MISKKEFQALLNDLESDRVERTISTDTMDKFGIGADDKTGKVVPIDITDRLLQKIASIRTEGNIQPQPSMTVEKVELDEGSVVVANETKNETKNETIDMSKSAIEVYNAIVLSPNDTRANLIVKLNISESTVNRAILELKQKGIIERTGGKRYGYWKILRNIRNDKSC